MRADVRGGSVVVARLPRRNARARLFSASGRSLLIMAAVAAGAALALAVVVERAHSTPAGPAPAHAAR